MLIIHRLSIYDKNIAVMQGEQLIMFWKHLKITLIKVKLFLCGLVLPAVFASCGSKEENNSDFNLNLEARFYDAPSDVQDYFFSSNDLFYKTTDGYYHYEMDENGNPLPVRLPVADPVFNKNDPDERQAMLDGAFNRERFSMQLVLADSGAFYRFRKVLYPINGKNGNQGNDGTLIREKEIFLEKYNENGELLFCKDIGSEIGHKTDHYKIIADKEDNIYFTNGERIVLFDSDGNVKQKISCDSYGVKMFLDLFRSDDHIWFFYAKDGTPRRYAARVTKKGELADERSIPGFWQFITPLSEDRFLHSYDGKIYLTDLKNNTTQTLAQWSDLSISPEELNNFTATRDGRLIAALAQPDRYGTIDEIAVISETDGSQPAEREILTLGTVYANRQLRAKIAKFNRSQKKIRVNLKEYVDQNLEINGEKQDDTKIINFLHLDIVSGKSPDILCLDYADIEDLAYKKAFADLKSYIDKEKDFNLPDNVADAYTFNDMLAGIPLYVRIRTLFLRNSGFSGEWTPEGFMEYLSAWKAAGADMPAAESVLTYLLTCNIGRFVDFEAGTCDFASEKFEALLSFCKDIGGGLGNTNVRTLFKLPSGDENYKWLNDEMIETSLNGLWDISALTQIFDTKELNFTGYPHDAGDSGYVLEAVGGAYAISASSNHKEAAWEFIRYMAKEDQKASQTIYLYDRSGFPMEDSSRKEYYSYTSDKIFSFGDLVFLDPKPEETEQLEAIISRARMLSKKETDILDIVLGEARDCFTLGKPAQEAAAVIQSKVGIYLSE